MHMQCRHLQSTGHMDGIASMVACRSLRGDTTLQVQDTGCKKGTETNHYAGMKTGDVENLIVTIKQNLLAQKLEPLQAL